VILAVIQSNVRVSPLRVWLCAPCFFFQIICNDVLCIMHLQVDIATVDIIERASKADPEGKRTVGVLTKPDLVSDGAHQPVVATLLNITKPLRLGYVMVKVSNFVSE
jgi:hypothetical protein